MKMLRGFAALCLAATLVGCLADDDSAGIEGTGSPATVVSGSVTAYGSIYVNGVHLDVSTAEVLVNGEPAGESDVKLGMVVDVEAESLEGESAVATRVRYRRALRAPVDALTVESSVRRELTMLGQSVVVVEDSQLDGVAFEALEVGLWLDVSGFTNAAGEWVATRVAPATEQRLDIRGPLSGLDQSAQRFQVNALEVAYSEAEILGGELSSGQDVRLLGGEQRGQRWHPEQIMVLDDRGPAESSTSGANRFVEGVIQQYDALAAFELAGVEVDASGATVEGDLALVGAGARVSVRGRLEDDVLVAERLQLQLPGVLRLSGQIDAVDPEEGVLVLLGSEYQSTGLTVFDDRTSAGRQPFGLTRLAVGDRVEVLARYQGETLVVTRVKRLPSGDSTVTLRGPVTAVDQANQLIQVLGTQVSLQGAVGSELLADVRRGTQVSIRGQMIADKTLAAEELSLADVPGSAPGVCPPPLAEECSGTVPPPFSAAGSTLRF